MKRFSLFKRCVACALSAAICLGIMAYSTDNDLNAQTASALSQEAQDNENKISDAQKQIEDLMKQQQELDSQIKTTQGNIEKEEENQKAINKQIETVQKTILALEESINVLNGQIADLTTDIEKSELEIIKKREEIDTGTEEFKKRLRALYIVGDDSYSSIIAGATDFYDMLMKVELVKRVANHDNEMIDNLIALKAQYEADKKVLEEKKAALETNKKTLEDQQKNHEAQRSKLQDLMNQSKEIVERLEIQKAAFEANKNEIQQQQGSFEDELAKLYQKRKEIQEKEEAERKRKEEEQRKQLLLQQQLQQQQQSSGWVSGSTGSGYVSTGSGKLAWPVPGYYGTTSEFGPRWGTNHNGLDISSWGIRGANICAAAPGEVILVSNLCPHDVGKNYSCGCGGGYGRYCIIDHGNGLWTLYGHQQNVSVKVGQKVNTGDVLGQVGSTGFSTGDHLHFEVRVNNVAVNPRLFL